MAFEHFALSMVSLRPQYGHCRSLDVSSSLTVVGMNRPHWGQDIPGICPCLWLLSIVLLLSLRFVKCLALHVARGEVQEVGESSGHVCLLHLYLHLHVGGE